MRSLLSLIFEIINLLPALLLWLIESLCKGVLMIVNKCDLSSKYFLFIQKTSSKIRKNK